MALRKGIESSSWNQRSLKTSEFQLNLHGSHFIFEKELMASKSGKIASLLTKNPHGDLSIPLRDIPADNESIEIVGRFCYGFGVDFSPENIMRITCVAHYLGMTDGHSPENLLTKALVFFEQQIIPNWRNCIKALKHSVSVLQPAIKLGLVKCCVETIIFEVVNDPRLLGEPSKILKWDEEEEEVSEKGKRITMYKPNARRKLFDISCKSEDLTSLPIELYETIMDAMIESRIPREYIASSLCEYSTRWVFSESKIEDDISVYERNSLRRIIEALVKMLPEERCIIPCKFLFKLLHYTIFLECDIECKTRLETRIGIQLNRASPEDLLIPCYGYANDEKYDIECVKRMLKHFYCNYNSQDCCGIISVAELIEEFLSKIATDSSIKISTFTAFVDMSSAVSIGIQRTCDGMYRAIDIYLENHRHLTDSEREELCGLLDCSKMSPEALQHIAQNERLPVRVMVQALFVIQLNLRKTVSEEVFETNKRVPKPEEEEHNEEQVRNEIEKMGSKVMELEKECSFMRRRFDMESAKRQKPSFWSEMKRKMGCITTSTTVHDYESHMKKKQKKINPK